MRKSCMSAKRARIECSDSCSLLKASSISGKRDFSAEMADIISLLFSNHPYLSNSIFYSLKCVCYIFWSIWSNCLHSESFWFALRGEIWICLAFRWRYDFCIEHLEWLSTRDDHLVRFTWDFRTNFLNIEKQYSVCNWEFQLEIMHPCSHSSRRKRWQKRKRSQCFP